MYDIGINLFGFEFANGVQDFNFWFNFWLLVANFRTNKHFSPGKNCNLNFSHFEILILMLKLQMRWMCWRVPGES